MSASFLWGMAETPLSSKPGEWWETISWQFSHLSHDSFPWEMREWGDGQEVCLDISLTTTQSSIHQGLQVLSLHNPFENFWGNIIKLFPSYTGTAVFHPFNCLVPLPFSHTSWSIPKLVSFLETNGKFTQLVSSFGNRSPPRLYFFYILYILI